jgi:putative transcriptional regulator
VNRFHWLADPAGGDRIAEQATRWLLDSKLIRDTRKNLHCSRAFFARKLRINERTLEKWEQGRAKPNPQAAALVLLVRKYPDTLDRLERVAVG